MEQVAALVIGAGPGGLGTAGLLTAAGVDTVLLERGDGVGNKWRQAYDRLRINTSTLTSYLPGSRFPLSVGLWASRDELVGYYERYATAHGVDARLGVTTERIEPKGGHWVVGTTSGQFIARHVVVAIGRDAATVIPPWPGRDDFGGILMHTRQYRNAAEFVGAHVLVVGVGNSGADIAVDLLEGGAASVSVSVQTPPHIIKRSVGGIPNDVLQELTRRLPARLVDRAGEIVRRRSYGDLESLGLQRPPTGIKTYIKAQARVPTIDAGPFSQAVRSQRIMIVPGVEALWPSGAVLQDGTRLSVDAVVAATGYRPELGPLIGHLGVLDERGWPRWAPAASTRAFPGLHLLGFGDPTRGNLRGLRLDARATARLISQCIGGRGAHERST